MGIINTTIQILRQQNFITPDQGGYILIKRYVKAVLLKILPSVILLKSIKDTVTILSASRIFLGKQITLLVINLQNNIITKIKEAVKDIQAQT